MKILPRFVIVKNGAINLELDKITLGNVFSAVSTIVVVVSALFSFYVSGVRAYAELRGDTAQLKEDQSEIRTLVKELRAELVTRAEYKAGEERMKRLETGQDFIVSDIRLILMEQKRTRLKEPH